MARFIKDLKASKGQVPGSPILIGNQKMDQPVLRLMEYNPKSLVELELKSIDEAISSKSPGSVSWLNIFGIHDLDLMKQIGEELEFQPLLLEDIMNTDQRPKYEEGVSYNAFKRKKWL
jgi:magnesium transporter